VIKVHPLYQKGIAYRNYKGTVSLGLLDIENGSITIVDTLINYTIPGNMDSF